MEKNIIIFDNGGQTFDRYTIILPDGEMFGASVNPFHPQGFGMYVGNVCEKRNEHNYRHYDHKNGCWPAWLLKHEMKQYLKECKDNPSMGKRSRVLSLPLDVQKYITQLTSELV